MKTRLALVSLALVGVLAGCTGQPGAPTDPAPTTPDSSAPAVAPLDAGLAQLAARPGAELEAQRLADGLIPPTNRWFSGLVFGPEPLPVFPLPLSFGISEDGDGFGFGVPEVRTEPDTIFGGYRPTIQVEVPGATTWQVTDYDVASVTMTALADDEPLGSVVVTQGSPLVSFTAAGEITLTTGQAFVDREGRPTASDGTTEYVAQVSDGGTVEEQSVTVPEGGTATWVALPQDGDAAEVLDSAAPVSGTTASWDLTDDAARTTIGYTTADGGPTLIATRPHHRAGLEEDCALGTYPSAYGEMALCSGTELSWTAPLRDAPLTLGLDVLTDEEAADVEAALEVDVAEEPPYHADTYFGGKALARDAQLWTIATELGREDLASSIRERAVAELRDWAEPAGCVDDGDARCFFYDEANRGIVGQTPSFGSEEFNDHHFHYGYFLYAAGVFAHDDEELARELAPVLQVLPVTPSSRYLGDDPARVATNLAEGLGGKDFTQQYGDLLLAYSALAGEDERQAALEVVDEVPIDNGNSRTFLKAWLHLLGH